MIQIVDLSNDPVLFEAAAELLVSGFREDHPDAWPDLDAARAEVLESLDPGRIGRVAIDPDGTVAGWIGGNSSYAGRVWELHPLVVRPDRQGQGVGRALVADFEAQVRRRGGLTIVLGTDDEDSQTTISGIDLFPDPLGHLSRIRNLRRHSYGFYQKVGFVVTGVVPDANGFGKPDILMAKRVAPAV